MARRSPFVNTAPSYAGGGEPEPNPMGGYGGGGYGPEPLPPSAGGAGDGAKPIIDPRTGAIIGVSYPKQKVVLAPRFDKYGDPILDANGQPQMFPSVTVEYEDRLDPRPSQRVGRDPLNVAQDQVALDMARARFADYPEDRQMGRDIGYGNLDIARQRLGLDERFGVQDREFRDAVQKWQEARDARDFDAMQFWKQKAYTLDERAAERADKQLSLSADLGYARQRNDDTQLNVSRANVFGQDIDGNATGTVGMLTAGEQQRRFGNANLVGQQQLAQGNLEQARKTDAERFLANLRLQERGQQFAEEQATEGGRRADLGLKLQYMNARATPRVINSFARPGRF